jgi:hypothetical protein
MPTHAHCHRLAAAAPAEVATVLIALFFAAPANASVYKCAGENGAIVYQESPCPEGKELRNFDTDPPTLSVIPGAVGTPAPPQVQPPPDRATKRSAPAGDDRSRGKVDGDATARKFIHAGMTETEVVARIGRPDMTAGGNKNHRSRWSYLPNADDPDTITTITFNGETVSDVTRKLVKR